MSGIIWALLVEYQAASCAGFIEIDLTESTFKAPTWKHLWRSEVTGKNNRHDILC